MMGGLSLATPPAIPGGAMLGSLWESVTDATGAASNAGREGTAARCVRGALWRELPLSCAALLSRFDSRPPTLTPQPLTPTPTPTP